MFLKIDPNWEEIGTVRSNAKAFLAAAGISPASAQAVEMVASELVENAIKYGVFEKRRQKIEVRIDCVIDSGG